MFHHTFFSNELSFSILFSFDSLFGERKKGGIRENLFQDLKYIRRSFERVEKKKKKETTFEMSHFSPMIIGFQVSDVEE